MTLDDMMEKFLAAEKVYQDFYCWAEPYSPDDWVGEMSDSFCDGLDGSCPLASRCRYLAQLYVIARDESMNAAMLWKLQNDS